MDHNSTTSIDQLSFSIDGASSSLTKDGEMAVIGYDTVGIYDITSHNIKYFKHKIPVNWWPQAAIGCNPFNTNMYVGNYNSYATDTKITIFSVDGELLQTINPQHQAQNKGVWSMLTSVNCFKFSESRPIYVVGGAGPLAIGHISDTEEDMVHYVTNGIDYNMDIITSLDISPDNSKLLATDFKGSFYMQDIDKGHKIICDFISSRNVLNLIATFWDNNIFVTASQQKPNIKVWDLRVNKSLSGIRDNPQSAFPKDPADNHRDQTYTITTHVERNFLYTGDRYGTIKVWDMRTQKCMNTVQNDISNDNFVRSLIIYNDMLYYTLDSGHIGHMTLDGSKVFV